MFFNDFLITLFGPNPLDALLSPVSGTSTDKLSFPPPSIHWYEEQLEQEVNDYFNNQEVEAEDVDTENAPVNNSQETTKKYFS